MSNSQSFLSRLFWWWPGGSVAEITAQELNVFLSEGARSPQLLDVRSAKEFEEGHISGALNVPITEFKSRFGNLNLNPELPVVAICLSAHRSIPAVRLLKQAGYQDACQLAGGMKAWRASSLDEV